MNNKIKIKKGFSIGEVILSVFIVGMILTALITMYSTGIREFLDERDNVVASLLAQEGVELIRNIRDNDWVNSGSLDTTLTDGDCAIDINDSDCSGNAYNLVYSSGFYVKGAGSEFKRKITIDDIGNSNPGEKKFRVTSMVTWNNQGFPSNIDSCSVSSKCVFSQAELTDWGDTTI